MKIIVNDTSVEIPPATTVEAALEYLNWRTATVATALNGEFLTRKVRAGVFLSEGDRLEILTPMQGG